MSLIPSTVSGRLHCGYCLGEPVASPPGEWRPQQLEAAAQPVLWVQLFQEVGTALQGEPVPRPGLQGCSAAQAFLTWQPFVRLLMPGSSIAFRAPVYRPCVAPFSASQRFSSQPQPGTHGWREPAAPKSSKLSLILWDSEGQHSLLFF